jgi:hypothetical protein
MHYGRSVRHELQEVEALRNKKLRMDSDDIVSYNCAATSHAEIGIPGPHLSKTLEGCFMKNFYMGLSVATILMLLDR